MSDREATWALRGLYALLLAVAALTVWDYGLTWDEARAHYHGKNLALYYAGWLRGEPDPELLEFRKYYGGLFEIGAVLVQSSLGLDWVQSRHLLNAAFGLAAVAGCAAIARALGGPQAAFCAALLLTLSPRFYGHMFNNPKDIPFAAAYAWSLAFTVRALRDMPLLPLGRIAQLGVAVGAALGMRVGALLCLGHLGLAMAGHGLLAFRERGAGALREDLPRLAVSFAGVTAVAWGVMLAVWPWALAAPLRRPLEALGEISDFPFDLPVRFAGSDVPATELPRSYGVHMLAITAPEIVLVLLAIGVVWGALRLRGSPPPESRTAFGVLLVAFAGVFPVAWIAIRDSTIYDGIRHLLFVLPALTALAGLMLAALVQRAVRRSRTAGRIVLAAVGVAVIVQLVTLVRLHPYQVIYYNGLVGGVPGAQGRYEIDYWGSPYREATLRLVREIEVAEGKPSPPDTRKVLLCDRFVSTRTALVAHYLPDGWETTKAQRKADFYLSLMRWNCDEQVSGREFFRIERQGVPLVVAKDLRSAPASP